ncbi:hypothetical protein T4D_6304 [Trichinella pseudospiralis]|uniref:Uncharacterized protein n=1 Tax=Trichinella pseudospiralis TaxID=6337 RepID=A0A0V1DSC2_TRIPS|nr:hypothetical protein T4D_6304 [Trichinella pseudospiralis]
MIIRNNFYLNNSFILAKNINDSVNRLSQTVGITSLQSRDNS